MMRFDNNILTNGKMIHNSKYDGIVATIGGILGSLTTTHVWLQAHVPSIQPFDPNVHLFLEDYMIKFAATLILAIVGSILGLLGKDIYYYEIKPHLFKNKKKQDGTPKPPKL